MQYKQIRCPNCNHLIQVEEDAIHIRCQWCAKEYQLKQKTPHSEVRTIDYQERGLYSRPMYLRVGLTASLMTMILFPVLQLYAKEYSLFLKMVHRWCFIHSPFIKMLIQDLPLILVSIHVPLPGNISLIQ